MTAGARPRPLSVPADGLVGALVGMAALTGCSAEVVGQASEAVSNPTAGSSSSAADASTGPMGDVRDLSAGLLPAGSFGAGARATPISADQVAQGQDQLGGLGTDDVTIAPDSCAPAVRGTQPGLADLAALGAQTVITGSGAVVEILAAGPGIADGVDQLTATVDTCPQATISSARLGTATVTFAPLDVPDLGDGSAGLTMTMSTTGPTGEPLTVPVLLGMAKDGDRLVSLTATDATGAGDRAAFAALLQQAYDHQAAVLG